MRAYGPAPLLLGIALTVGAGQLLELPGLKRRFVRDDLARVLGQSGRVLSAQDADVLLLGNSRMWAAVDAGRLTTLLGRPCLNLGFAGATPTQDRFWLELFLKSHARPSSVVLALSPVDFSRRFPARERAAKYLDLGPRGPLDADGLGYALFPAFRYRTELKDALKRADPVALESAERRAEKAALPPGLVGIRDYTEAWLPAYEEDAGELAALEDLRALCRKEGIRLVTVRLPVARQLLDHERRVSGGRFERTAGIHLDLSDPSGWTFSDCNHLAPEAREAFTRALARRLSEPAPRP